MTETDRPTETGRDRDSNRQTETERDCQIHAPSLPVSSERLGTGEGRGKESGKDERSLVTSDLQWLY